MSSRFAFDVDRHQYIDLVSGEVLPHITGMLDAAGLTDPRWYTEASCQRGTAVHQMATAYDLDAIEEPQAVDSQYKGWLLAYVAAVSVLRPTWDQIEQAFIHETLRFGGRPDRGGRYGGGPYGTTDIKSGGPEKAHPVQTALQAILLAPVVRIPAEHIERSCLYLQATGKWKLVQHTNRRDYAVAHEVLRTFCNREAA